MPLLLSAALCLTTGLTPPAIAQTRTIRVVEGDTLEQLALTHGVTLAALIRLNGITDPALLQIGQILRLPSPGASATPSAHSGGGGGTGATLAPPPPDGSGGAAAAAALLLSPTERRDRAELELREQSGQARWKWFNATAVDWTGWRLHPGGVRITLVKPAAADLGLRGAAASAVGVQCETLRQNWRIDGIWQGWEVPAPGTVGQRIVLDLCSNTLDGPARPVAPVP
ncbi:LysM peptidoglycan-binding domain-containing protein [Vulcanococcus limneticus]|uniref:LysM peptidoglycan-binding domain-containing protein n=1 Tax=Vulcanococcus limneticus TaxID=2170428 RepID=UPI0018E3686C|nr:LysM peptidoglycan-binding domain-containing protein [Vulcanococcus limneticus]MCP9792722.1 LysM peptidoglycan-binding domain-containing protein [Vulcanococcus limneticus MW73D5]MCP9895230.1 LysM peptidoglycan-binding domain-containing protein [Vulcanococcus limneticus Candia 3F8]MCP9898159.1 LysM peptidoglycan-binding domain-containing protein [Vulcanococcus limneticus Candia 3B3]